MPSFLYYSDFDDINYRIRSVDTGTTDYKIQNDKALEMVYRVNVGQNQVPPNNDTGMFRNWDIDYPLYLKKQYLHSISSGYGEHLNYLNNTVANYTAPEDVYLTGRNYGNDAKEEYNVTWSFEVDSTFTYMIRLHFCEFDKDIKSQGYRVFQIFIDDILAEQGADVFSWSGGLLIPVHKDYVVTMYSPKGSSQIERVNISIKLQRMPEHSILTTAYRDVLLNGIEIFKISDNNKNLAGVNPKYLPPNEPLLPSPQSKSKNSTVIIFIAVGISCLLLASVVGMIVFVRRRRKFESHLEIEESSWETKTEGTSILPSHLCRYFTIAEIRAATNNFDDIFIIGVGGFGNVYKGYIDGVTPVAIKRLKPGSQQEFALELVMGEEDSKFSETGENEKSAQRLWLPQFTSDDGSDKCFTSSSDDYGSHTSKVSTISASTEDQPLFSGSAFSEIGNPRAR
ncbi:hypothetical protein P8452_63763 [Trifolium repens]|nr:hypothetical protein P8452_63763 [Trifolium repens]